MRGIGAPQWVEFGFWLLLAAFAWYFSYDFSRDVEMYRFGADGWPRLIIVLVVVAALGQLAHAWQEARVPDAADPQAMPTLWDRMAELGSGQIARMSFLLLLPIVYALLLENTGFYFTTPLFLAAYLFASGEHRWSRVVAIPLVISALVTVLFTRYLYMSLPVGYWPGFYDFSNWLVVLLRS